MSKESVYTEAVTSALIAEYVAQNGNYEAEQAVVAEYAENLGVKVASVRAKLSREGVYNAKAKTESRATVRKSELVAQLAELTGASEDVLGSLEKANRKALEIVVGRIRANIENA